MGALRGFQTLAPSMVTQSDATQGPCYCADLAVSHRRKFHLAMGATAELIRGARMAAGALLPWDCPMYDIAQTVADGIEYTADDDHAMKRGLYRIRCDCTTRTLVADLKELRCVSE